MSLQERSNEIKDISPIESVKNEELRFTILFTITELIDSNKFTKEDFDQTKSLLVNRYQNVESYLEDRIACQDLKWIDGKLVADLSRIELHLTPVEEEILRGMVVKTHTPACQLIRRIINEGLSNWNCKGGDNYGDRK